MIDIFKNKIVDTLIGLFTSIVLGISLYMCDNTASISIVAGLTAFTLWIILTILQFCLKSIKTMTESLLWLMRQVPEDSDETEDE